jgi:hypothetical protein
MTLAVMLISANAVLSADGKDGEAKGDDSPAGDSNWFHWSLWQKEKSPPKKKATGGDKDAGTKQEQAGKPDKEKQDEQAKLKREQAVYLRRLAVCDRLREVALRTNGETLSQKADQLEAQALAVYNKRIARFKASNAVYQADEAALDKAPSRQTNHSASLSTPASQTTISLSEPREEKP